MLVFFFHAFHAFRAFPAFDAVHAFHDFHAFPKLQAFQAFPAFPAVKSRWGRDAYPLNIFVRIVASVWHPGVTSDTSLTWNWA